MPIGAHHLLSAGTLYMALIMTLLMTLLFTACEERATQQTSTEIDFVGRSCESLSEEAIFERRVVPLTLEGETPSCARCHLPGVDLRPFIKENECQSLACLKEESLVDLESPEQSVLLSWITRGHEELGLSIDQDPLAQAEYDAFMSWITYQVKCHEQLCLAEMENPCEKRLPPPNTDLEVIVDLSQSEDAFVPPSDMLLDGGVDGLDQGLLDQELLDADPPEPDMEIPPPPPEDLCSAEGVQYRFRWEVWPLHGRCYYCHADHYSANSTRDQPPAGWMSDDRETIGAQVTAQRLLDSEYLDLVTPSESLILLKPLSEDFGGLPHGGGTKMRDLDDVLYVPLLAWIEHVASCRP